MSKVLYIILISLFSLTFISCSEEEYTENSGTTTTAGLYVAVGNSGTVLKSTYGTTWTTVSSTNSDNGSNSLLDNLRGVTYGSSTFVAVVGDGGIITSTDATAWTHRTSGTTNILNDVTYKE